MDSSASPDPGLSPSSQVKRSGLQKLWGSPLGRLLILLSSDFLGDEPRWEIRRTGVWAPREASLRPQAAGLSLPSTCLLLPPSSLRHFPDPREHEAQRHCPPPSPGLGQGYGRAVGADALCPPQSVAPGLERRSAGGPGLSLDAALIPLSGSGWGRDGRGPACPGCSERWARHPWTSTSRAGCDGQGSGDQLQTEEGRGPAWGSWGRAGRP